MPRRSGRRVLLWVAAGAAVVRGVYLGEHSGSAFFGVPVLDEKYYDAVARALVAGQDLSAFDPAFRPLLYPLFLALCYLTAGAWGFVLALVGQHLLGVLTAVVVADLAMRLFRRASAGAVAGGLYCLAGPPLFFEGELLITTLFTFLVTVLVWILARADDRPWGWLAAGAWIGVAAQARPNALLFLAAFPLAALVWRRPTVQRRTLLAGAALAGTVVALALCAGLQHRWLGRFQLVPSAGGVNFYLGNRLGADGMVPRQERWVTYGEEYRDSVQVFADDVYRRELARAGRPVPERLDPGAVSRFWLARSWDEIRADPARWLGLIGRKKLFLLWDREIPNNKSYDFVREQESALLRWLPVRWWLLLSLAAVGAVHAWRTTFADFKARQLLFWLLTVGALHAAGVVLFFVNGRYRLPLWPLLAVLAAGAPLAALATWRARDRRALVGGVALAAAVATVSLVNWLRIPPQSFARDYFFRSLAHLEKGDLARAEDDARRSAEIDPSDPAAHFQLGNVAFYAGHDQLAYDSYRAAADLAPREPRIYNNLGALHERLGRPADAYRGYLYALELTPDYAPALVNAALLELRAGLPGRAAAKVERAGELGFSSVPLTCARAFLARQQGRLDEARQLLAAAHRLDPELTARLAAVQERRLTPAEIDRGLPPPPPS